MNVYNNGYYCQHHCVSDFPHHHRIGVIMFQFVFVNLHLSFFPPFIRFLCRSVSLVLSLSNIKCIYSTCNLIFYMEIRANIKWCLIFSHLRHGYVKFTSHWTHGTEIISREKEGVNLNLIAIVLKGHHPLQIYTGVMFCGISC